MALQIGSVAALPCIAAVLINTSVDALTRTAAVDLNNSVALLTRTTAIELDNSVATLTRTTAVELQNNAVALTRTAAVELDNSVATFTCTAPVLLDRTVHEHCADVLAPVATVTGTRQPSRLCMGSSHPCNMPEVHGVRCRHYDWNDRDMACLVPCLPAVQLTCACYARHTHTYACLGLLESTK